jgi:hypothetical protein
MIEIVGKLGSCAARRIAIRAEEKQQPNIIIMLTGFCHFSDENFIDPISIAIAAETKVTRLTEKEVPPDRRRLIDAPANLPDRAAKVAAARSAVAALLARDETAFLKLHDPDTVSEMAALKGNAPYPQLRENFEEERAVFRKQAGAHGPFAGIRLGDTQERVFVDRRKLDAAKTDGQASVPVIVCWCKTADCKDKWPVAPADAGDNEPDRPYACAWTTDYQNTHGHGRSVETSSKGKGLAEPDWSKYRATN